MSLSLLGLPCRLCFSESHRELYPDRRSSAAFTGKGTPHSEFYRKLNLTQRNFQGVRARYRRLVPGIGMVFAEKEKAADTTLRLLKLGCIT